MKVPVLNSHKTSESLEQPEDNVSYFGFWVYLMTDAVLFGSLFATYAVLYKSTNGGPGGSELFSLPFILLATIILLTSSYTVGLAVLALKNRNIKQVLAWLSVTFVFGVIFLAMELTEFTKLAQEGNGWTSSAFLSAFFTLVGTHGLHITAGLIWIGVMFRRIWRKGFTPRNNRQLMLLAMFWHFLDVIWIFIFTVVYLSGAL